ncbi:MAG: hypothetical protein WKF43_09035 [Acidimicrobiales bacterium]
MTHRVVRSLMHGRNRDRFAFPDELNEVLEPFKSLAKASGQEQS